MTVILAVPVSILLSLALLCALLVAIPITVIESIGEWWERRRRRKYLLSEYNKWYDKAKSCDDFGGAIDKGKAVARLIVLKHEMDELDKK